MEIPLLFRFLVRCVPRRCSRPPLGLRRIMVNRAAAHRFAEPAEFDRLVPQEIELRATNLLLCVENSAISMGDAPVVGLHRQGAEYSAAAVVVSRARSGSALALRRSRIFNSSMCGEYLQNGRLRTQRHHGHIYNAGAYSGNTRSRALSSNTLRIVKLLPRPRLRRAMQSPRKMAGRRRFSGTI